MKYIFLAIPLFFCIQLVAQNQDAALQSKIDILNSKIEQTEKGERLVWLDSLTKLTYRKSEFNYDSIVRRTVSLAISIDSLNLAAKRVTDLMGFYNNFLGKPEEGLKLFNTYIDKLQAAPDTALIGYVYLNAGDSYYYIGDYKKSFEFYDITTEYAKKSEDERLYGFALLYTGYNESDKGKFTEASMSLKEAIEIFKKLKDTSNILGAKNSLATLYSKNAFFVEAKKERDEAIVLAEKINSYTSLRNLYGNAAEDDYKMGDAFNQIANLKKSIRANANAIGKQLTRPLLLTKLIKAYAQNDSLTLAEENFKEIEANYLNNQTKENQELYVDAKRWLSLGKADYKNAIKFGHEYLGLRRQKESYEEIMFAEKFLGDVYEYENDRDNSNIHFVKYYRIKDSISSVQNVKSLAYYQTLYETEKRDFQIDAQKANISVLNLQNKNKNQWLIFGGLGLLVSFCGILFYRSFVNAKKRELAQQEFSHELINTQEQERTRIAKDLHDGVGQQITLLKMKAQNAEQTELSGLAHAALEEIRSISRDLYPVTLKKLGLKDSIEQLLLDLDEETDMFVSVEIDDVNTSFNEIESLNFYRFIQESVNNVLRHSNAKTLVVNILKQNDGIKILIKDNGQGFEVGKMIKQNSLGLKTMAERISMLRGKLSIKSQREVGTSILVQIPI